MNKWQARVSVALSADEPPPAGTSGGSETSKRQGSTVIAVLLPYCSEGFPNGGSHIIDI